MNCLSWRHKSQRALRNVPSLWGTKEAGRHHGLAEKQKHKKNVPNNLLICMCWSDHFPSPFTVFTQENPENWNNAESTFLWVKEQLWCTSFYSLLWGITEPCQSQTLTHLSVSVADGLREGTPSLSILHLHRCIVGQQQVGTLYKRYRQRGI